MQVQKLTKRKRKAQLEGNKALLASICIDLADFYLQEGNYEDAINEYSIVAEVYETLEKFLDFARANRMIGETYIHLREYDKALNYQQIYLKIAKEQNDKIEEQRALATIGHTYLTNYLDTIDNPDQSCLKFAHKFFIKSLAVSESLENVISKREHKDMTARLLANLGVVEECRGNYTKGIELVYRSINICKAQDLYEQLERNYTLLGSLYVRTKEYNKAIHQYNLAIEVAGRLKNKVLLMSSSLSSKANVLIKLSDFRGAKTVLLKAYKLKTLPNIEKENIADTLKIVAAMCYTEDSLLITGDLDYKMKKRLFEKLGDGACALKNYTIAIDYYQKMLESAINNGESGLLLSPCYISLAETYRDDKQFELAIKYFKEEHGTCQINTKESVSTLLNICDCMEALNKNFMEIQTFYIQAQQESIKSQDKNLQCKVLSRYVAMLRKFKENTKADEIENELVKIGCSNTESDTETLDEQETPNIGDDISISNITDESDGSDTENLKERSLRKRTKCFGIKKNDKGESQLHTACINGNITVVKHLLDQGHPVNVRDNCGWLPIHEACICGHVEIVSLLIEKGASVNDRGGTLCNGMTPMHDAATNGHLEVLQVLLNKGALTTSKNDAGEIPLQILKKWKLNNQLDNEEQVLYDQLLKRLEQDAEKIGYCRDVNRKDSGNFAIILSDEENDMRGGSRDKAKVNHKIGKLRKNLSFDEDIDKVETNNKERLKIGNLKRNITFDDDSDTELSIEKPSHVTDDYKQLMNSLKHPNRTKVVKKRKSFENRRQSAHLTLNDNTGDWLEDDITNNQLKRKKTNSSEFITTLGTRKSSNESMRRSSSTSLKSKSSFTEELDIADDFSDSDLNAINVPDPLDNITNVIYDSDDQFKPSSSTKKRKTQSSLIQQGFTRTHDFYPSNIVNSATKSSNSPKPKHQTKLTNFGSAAINKTQLQTSITTPSPYMANNIFTNEPMLSVDVQIEGKLYRVPVPASEIYVNTIKWLADEAAKRYGRKESLKPTLELETKNGAVLAEEDMISILFLAGSTKAEEIQARILNWNLPPLLERYKEACINANTGQNEIIKKILSQSSTSINLTDLGLSSEVLGPFCRAINRQNNLHSLDLSGNVMSSKTVQWLCSSLSTLDNLCSLNLSSNMLTYDNLELIANMFTQSSKPILENLINLDLSYNPLGDESFKYLAIISRYLKLQVLNLKSVNFTNHVFNVISNRNVDLSLDYVVDFDISYNSLTKQEISAFVSWLIPQNVEILNISNNSNSEQGLVKEVINWLQKYEHVKIQTLNLSRCEVTDLEVFELLRVLNHVETFKTINLSYNESLTSMSLRRLVNHSSLINLDLSGCKNIFKYFDGCTENTWTLTNLKELKVSFDCDNTSMKNILVNAWKSKYKEEACINNLLNGFLQLCLTN